MVTNLLHGDCIEMMRSLPENAVDMVLCDLPYGVTRNPWDSVIPLELLWEQWRRVTKENAAVVLFGQGMFTAKLMMSNPKEWRYNLVWDKVLPSGFLNANKAFLRSHEDIVVFYRNPPVFNPQMGLGLPTHSRGRVTDTTLRRNQSTNYGHVATHGNDRSGETSKFPVSIVSFPKPHPSCAVHPTEKPVNLLRYLIRTFTDEGMTVLDSTMGSGSTGVAAILEGRGFVGVELDDGYFELAERRIRDAEVEMKSRLF